MMSIPQIVFSPQFSIVRLCLMFVIFGLLGLFALLGLLTAVGIAAKLIEFFVPVLSIDTRYLAAAILVSAISVISVVFIQSFVISELMTGIGQMVDTDSASDEHDDVDVDQRVVIMDLVKEMIDQGDFQSNANHVGPHFESNQDDRKSFTTAREIRRRTKRRK